MKEITLREFLNMSDEDKNNLSDEYRKDCIMVMRLSKIVECFSDEEILDKKIMQGFYKKMLESIR